MSTFHLQIVTPDGGFFDGEAEKLIVRAIDGDVGKRLTIYVKILTTVF